METVSLTRSEWAAVARELDARHGEFSPPGLRERIRHLLDGMPIEWDIEYGGLELDAANAALVRQIVQRGRGRAGDAALEQSQRESVSEAESIIRDHQHRDRDA